MTHVLRDENGILKVKCSSLLTRVIMDTVEGHFIEKIYVNEGRKICYVIDVDSLFNPSPDLKVYLWKGDVLIPE